MARKSHYLLLLLLLSGLFSACSKHAIEDNMVVVDAVGELISPVDNIALNLTKELPAVKFEWQAAAASSGITPKYEIIFFKENAIPSEAISKIAATTTNTVLSEEQLNEIAEKAGIDIGSSGIINWVVRAYSGGVSTFSKQIHRLEIKRFNPVEPITKLFLTGSGSEFGENISDAMAFDKRSDSEFVIFSKLTAGQPFKVTNNNDGDNIRSFSIKNDQLVEDDGSDITVQKTGVYSIRVNTSTLAATMKPVTDLSLFYCIKSRGMKLDYIGHGKWNGIALISFTKEAWGDEKRYKFRMTEGGVDKFLEKASDTSTSMTEDIITDQGAQLWSGVWSYDNSLKDQWVQVVVDMSNYTNSFKVVPEDFSGIGSSWEALAERSSSDFLKGYWNTTEDHFNNSLSGTVNPHDYWPEAHAIDVIIDAYLRSGEAKYKQIIYDFYDGVKQKNGGTFKNAYYDDMAWHGLAHLRAFEATGDTRYETSARDLYHWVLQGWDDAGDGIKQRDDPSSGIGVPSTGPATIMAIRRWVKYGDSEVVDGLNDLQWAKKMYDGMRKYKYDPTTGAVYDGAADKTSVWTYNAGTFMGAAMELYDVTREQQYLDDAIKTADWTLANLSLKTPGNRILSDWAEQQDNDVNLFKGIFMRYFTRLIMEPDLPASKRSDYVKFIEYNAKALVTYASAITDNNIMIYNYGWYFKPSDAFLRAQTSGCTLIEAMALLEKKGYL